MNKTSILRWSGSKAKLVAMLLSLRPATFERYIEPFAGSAQLFFALTPSKAVLGDLNPHVMAVYRAIAEDPVAVSEALESIPKSVDAYYTLRALDPSQLSLAQRAARLIFLMKSCFNGVYRTNKNGIFNVPMGNRIYALPSLDELISAQTKLSQTQLVDGDFMETLNHSNENDWIYLDPPYRQQGRYRGEYGYSAEFNSDKLACLIHKARDLADSGRKVMLSYAYDARLLKALPEWRAHHVQISRTVASTTGARQRVHELILTSYPT